VSFFFFFLATKRKKLYHFKVSKLTSSTAFTFCYSLLWCMWFYFNIQ